MSKDNEFKLGFLEKLVIGAGIPINTIGYVLKNQTNPFSTAKFYWNYKSNKYKGLVRSLENGGDVTDIIQKYMKLACYRAIIKMALKRSGKYSDELFQEWRRKHPLDLDRSFNPKYIPKKSVI